MHEFLSEEWLAAVEQLRDETPAPPEALRDLVINVVVTDSPFGEREAHLAAGRLERGLVEGAPTTVSLPYDVAKALFIDQNPQAAMQAFMAGKIRVTGDMTKLMAIQGAGVDPTEEQRAFQTKLQALTA